MLQKVDSKYLTVVHMKSVKVIRPEIKSITSSFQKIRFFFKGTCQFFNQVPTNYIDDFKKVKLYDKYMNFYQSKEAVGHFNHCLEAVFGTTSKIQELF
jgi:hypothetical protein